MEIYIVQPNDSINSIAEKYGITVERLISDNGLLNPYALVPGQALVILYPQNTYTVKPDDTLASIADSNGVSMMQLVRNNPFLYERNYLYPGESIYVNFRTDKDIHVNGYTYAFINRDILKRTLPYLTYISVFNYRITENGDIDNYGDDTDIIRIAMEYQVIPLLMISAFSPTGELNLDSVYNLLLNEEKQDKIVNDMLQLVRSKGFFGINALVSHLTETNQNLYINVFTKLSKALRDEGYIFMLSTDPRLKKVNDSFTYENLDYKKISLIADRIIFLQNIWGVNKQPPAPVSNISLIRSFIDIITKIISPDIVSIGKPLIGYDWILPFIEGSSYANSISLNSVLTLAYENKVIIQFDDESQTPYFNYIKPFSGTPESHIVWFVDARSINALDDVIIDYDLIGSGIWNLSTYNQQLWSIINSRFTIVKLLT